MRESLIKYITDHDGCDNMTIIKMIREFMEAHAVKKQGPELSYKFEVEVEPGNTIICAIPDHAFWRKIYTSNIIIGSCMCDICYPIIYSDYWNRSDITYAVTFGEHTLMVRNQKSIPNLQCYINAFAQECTPEYLLSIMPICMLETYFNVIDRRRFKSNSDNDLHIFARDFPLSSPLIIPRKYVAAYCSEDYADIQTVNLSLETLSDSVIKRITEKFDDRVSFSPMVFGHDCNSEMQSKRKPLEGDALWQYLYLIDILGIKYDKK